MTDNKPEVIGYASHHDEPMLFLSKAEAATYCEDGEEPVALIRLSDYERLQAECDALRNKISLSLGVGDGTGNLFVHGDFDSIQRVQELIFEYEELCKDAERYRWLRNTLHNAKAGGGVEVNEALQAYDTPVKGEEVRVYWYQDTPVGFYQSEATTLDEAIDAAMTKR